MANKRIAGVILAGGRSSRMGRDKAALDYEGRPLLAHMAELLGKTGVADVFISGSVRKEMPHFHYLPDDRPYAGPAAAISNIIKQLSDYEGALFVPVDMPLLTPVQLGKLLEQERGGWFRDWPLPVYIPVRAAGRVDSTHSVHELLEAWDISAVEPDKDDISGLINVNTPEQWQEIAV